MGSLSSHKNTIDACLRLHNFIVDYREAKKRHTISIEDDIDEMAELNYASDTYMVRNPFHVFGSSSGESDIQEYAPRGRRSNIVNQLREEGKRFWDMICTDISNMGMG